MSSTETGPDPALIREFFRREVLPLRAAFQDRPEALFPRRYDPGAESYFLKRRPAAPTPQDLEWPEITSAAQLEEKLRRLWAAPAYPEWERLAAAVGRLAADLSRTEAPGDEVSPFIYVMF